MAVVQHRIRSALRHAHVHVMGLHLQLRPLSMAVQGETRAQEGAEVHHTLMQMPVDSTRTGLLAYKVGMLSLFDKWGRVLPCTVLYVHDCQVVQVKTEDTDGYTAMALGCGQAKPKNVAKPQLKIFEKLNMDPKRKIMEFRVTPDALLPPGTTLSACHFVPGQLVDVCGISKGKGYQGAVKRWGFAGGRASHGSSLFHRGLGSTGSCQDPGRVWKGKKMAGRMGSDRVTVQNLWVYKIDPSRNLLYVKGQVPGNKGGVVRITDAIKGPYWPTLPPFPTYLASDDAQMEEMYAPFSEEDLLKPVECTDPL